MFEMALAAGGMALSLLGSQKSSQAADAYYKSQQNVAGLEEKVNDQRRAAMEVDAQRRQLEVVRNNQRARAMALTTATNQGAQFGSGLQGAYGGISGQSETNLLGINQNLEIGRNIFGLDSQISQERIAQAGFQSKMNQGQGEASLGNMLMSSSNKLGKIGQSFSQGYGNPGGFNLFSMMSPS